MASPTNTDKHDFRQQFDDSDSWVTQNILVTWSGLYLQDNKTKNLMFANLQVEQGGSITGSGQDHEGRFFIEGHIWQPNSVKLIKQYASRQSVYLTGKITGGFIEGEWQKDGRCGHGRFFAEVEGLDKWFGVLRDTKGNAIKSIILDMVICPHGIYGMGSDGTGEYVIKGIKEKNSIRFVLCYHFTNEVYFSGKILKEEPDRIIKGTWGKSDAEGIFELASSASRERQKLPDASDMMRKMQELVMGGPISPRHQNQICQERLVGYTGPMTRPSEYSVAGNQWVVHPGKCRFDHVLQNGQGSLKGASINLNIPDKPAWGNEDLFNNEKNFASDMSPTYKPQSGINIKRLNYTPCVTSNKYLNYYENQKSNSQIPDFPIQSLDPQSDPLKNDNQRPSNNQDEANKWVSALTSPESDLLPKKFGQYMSKLTTVDHDIYDKSCNNGKYDDGGYKAWPGWQPTSENQQYPAWYECSRS